MNASLDPARLSAATPAPARALMPGAVVDGFEIVRVIADSDLGIEYLAIDPQRAAQVVLFEYMPQRLARREGATVWPQTPLDAEALGRGLLAFVDEARMLARVHHPSLVRVMGVIEVNATAYQVVSPPVGTPLLHVRQAMDEPPDERALRALLDGVLGALDALHRHGQLHGGVSPGSILVLPDDRPLLLGPDRARAAASSGLVESLMATVEPSFTAPEQRAPSPARPLGPWSDLYSLAETMRFFIGGELPPPAIAPPGRGGREPIAQMVQRLFGQLPALYYSRGLLATLDAALDTNPTARPQSVAEFRAALGAMRNDVLPARPSARVEPAFRIDLSPPVRVEARAPRAAAPHAAAFRPPRARRSGWWPWASGAFALLLMAGTYGWWRIDSPERADTRAELPAAVIEPSAQNAPSVPALPPEPEPAPMPIIEPAPPPAAALAPVPAAALAPVPAPPAPTIMAAPAPTPAAPVRPKVVAPPSPATPTSPRDACAGRTQFALYRCMQALCEQRGWSRHAQCERLRATDSVE